MTDLKECVELLQLINAERRLRHDGPHLENQWMRQTWTCASIKLKVTDPLIESVWGVCDYHIAFGGVFNGLDHPQSLFEPHLLDHICSNGAELLQTTVKMSKHAVWHRQNTGPHFKPKRTSYELRTSLKMSTSGWGSPLSVRREWRWGIGGRVLSLLVTLSRYLQHTLICVSILFKYTYTLTL